MMDNKQSKIVKSAAELLMVYSAQWRCRNYTFDYAAETDRLSCFCSIIEGALNYVKECGMYAYQYNTGKISEDDVNPMLFAYTDDDIYDYVEDAIAIFAEANPKKITYNMKDIG